MTGSAALAENRDGYWAFLDALVESEVVKRIRLKESDGDRLIAELKRCPLIDFGSFAIDFRGDYWDFSGVTDLNVNHAALRFRFAQGPMVDEQKLFVITGVIWRSAKVQTIKTKFRAVKRAVGALGLDRGSIRLLAKESVEAYLASLRQSLAPSSLGTSCADLADFLEFYERLFGRLVDPDVVPFLRATASRCAKLTSQVEGYPCIPPEYATPLIDAAERVMRDDDADPTLVITASVIVILFEVGFRSGECCGLEVGAIEVVKGSAGLPDIAYLTFKSFKGESGDGAYRLRRTVISARALEAYLRLEDLCRKKRERLGVRTLVVYPQQRGAFCCSSSLNAHIRRFLLRHSAEIPCVNSDNRFPELPTMLASKVAGRSVDLAELGLSDGDSLVYVTPQMFRVTFATRLYERGYDLAVISEFMNHISSDTTVGYIRTEREISREVSDMVYRALLVDGAQLLGPHGEEFSALVGSHVEGRVYESEEALVADCSKAFPLRLKTGYVCTKCGSVKKCPSDSKTDEVFCAFGVCQNQHHMYFMVDVHLEAARFHMDLVEENRSRGHVMAAKNELRKACNVVRGTILPEMESLDEQIAKLGEDHVLQRHPHLGGIVRDRALVAKEVSAWLEMDLAD